MREVERAINDRVMSALQESGHGIRRAYLDVFRHLPIEGCTQVQLAARMRISKQAVGELVREMAAAGLLEVEAHPSDGRASWVRPAPASIDGYRIALRLMEGLHGQWERALGAERLAELERTLDDLLRLLRDEGGAEREGSPAL
jgi:DNA-binding MarR family transcriptional regulator